MALLIKSVLSISDHVSTLTEAGPLCLALLPPSSHASFSSQALLLCLLTFPAHIYSWGHWPFMTKKRTRVGFWGGVVHVCCISVLEI